MAGAISSVSYMGMFAILLMIMKLEAVDTVTAWDCSSDKLLATTVKFSDINDEKLVISLKKLGNKYSDEFAYKFMGVKGFIANMQKDMFYIFQCERVAAILKPQDKCYDRLPIMINNKNLFLSPWTYIVATKANEISCNAPNLQDYKLESNTYKVGPRPEGSLDLKEVDFATRNRKNPSVINVLKPNISLTWKYTKMSTLGTSEQELNKTEKELNSTRDNMLHPDSHRGGEGAIDHDNKNYGDIENPNAPEIPWYKRNYLYLVFIGIGVLLLIVTILCVFACRKQSGRYVLFPFKNRNSNHKEIKLNIPEEHDVNLSDN